MIRLNSFGKHAHWLRCIGVLVSLLLMSCGSDTSFGDNADAGPGFSDAGTGGCRLYLLPPSQANVGQVVEIGVLHEGSVSGVISYSWSVRRAGVEQVLTELSDPVDRVSFVPTEAGPLEVLVEATVGGESCQPATGDINVIATGALAVDYRMRVQPISGAPMQDVALRIFGGADTTLPPTTLTLGLQVSGQILDSDGNGIAAYLRARRRDVTVQTDYEVFSDESGAFSMPLPDANFDITIVPQDTSLPSQFFSDRAISFLNKAIHMPPATPLSGHLLSAAGHPIAGARVHLLINGARSTEASTGSDGAFTVQGISGQLTGVAVAAPEGSGLPILRADSLAAQSIDSASDLIIRYAQPVISAQVNVALAGGGEAAFAKGEFRAELGNAGSIELAQVESIAGSLRVRATANGSGQMQTPLSAVSADLVIMSADDSQGLVRQALPWGTEPAQSISLASKVSAAIHVTAPASPLGTRVVAEALDALAPQTTSPTAVIGDAGTASVPLVRGGSYLLRVTQPQQGSITAWLLDVQPGLAATEVTLPGALIAKGTLRLASGVAAGAHVSLYCTSCEAELASRPIVTAVSDGAGRFVLRVPDPGVTAP